MERWTRRLAGAGIAGPIVESIGLVEALFVMGGLQLVAVAVLSRFDPDRHAARLAAVAAKLDRRSEPAQHPSLATGTEESR